MAGPWQRHPASFRDPSGFVFTHNGIVHRQINSSYQSHYDFLLSSGLYQQLTETKKLISHEEVVGPFAENSEAYKVIRPEQLTVVSYPYEWCFSALKDAALLTIEIALAALEKGMVLKDASAFNVQFHQGRAVFIDTLSFEIYEEGKPWIAYRQFCEHFLAPLALMHYNSLLVQPAMMGFLEGLPLSYASSWLPWRSRLNVPLYLHLHLHAAYNKTRATGAAKVTPLPKNKLVQIVKGLESLVQSLQLKEDKNVWGDYYEEASTRENYLEEKKAIIENWLRRMPATASIIDIGGNRGEFALLAANGTRQIICADGEHHAVDALYRDRPADANILPLLIDFSRPSPALGLNAEERSDFFSRAYSDVGMALALVHHLAIGKNIPLEDCAKMFARLCGILIVEFVPKEDEKAQLLLQNKKDIYQQYTEENFCATFATYFRMVEKQQLTSSGRTLYLMERL